MSPKINISISLDEQQVDLPDVHYGSVDQPQMSWSEIDEQDTDDVDDDEDMLLTETPQSTIDLLGFDPLELESDGEE
jgi:hypothetical protein